MLEPQDHGREASSPEATEELSLELSDLNTLHQLAARYGMEMCERVEDALFDPELVRPLPVDWARSRHMLPVRWDGRVAALTADPAQMADLNALGVLLGCDPVPVLTSRQEIDRAIQRCYFLHQETTQNFIRDLGVDDRGEADLDRPEQSQDLLRVVESAPVTRLVNLILLEAVQNGASDIHLEPYRERVRLRYRIDGILHEQAAPPKHLEAGLISRLKVMAHLDIAEKRLPQDGMTQVRIGDREMDIRLSTIPVADGERMVLRLLNTDQLVLPLEELGMPESIRCAFTDVLSETRGAVWVTGPTGSGKTTTLYAALQSLDTRRRSVLTIEDPIEYKLPDIGQMAVKPKIGLTFARGLRHILRQDPDVILVGETRDLETAEIAIRASLTGHLVFSTLHTNDAAGAVTRLIDMGIPPYLVASATRGILAQRLARLLCPHCAKPASGISASFQEAFGDRVRVLEGGVLREAVGCGQCHEGYRGRTGLYEWLPVGDELRSCIRAGGTPEALARHTVREERGDLLGAALEKVRAGRTSMAEILRVMGRS